jgi:murein DD-endopeptidase MepM/ murein hydrolase activator NlpD
MTVRPPDHSNPAAPAAGEASHPPLRRRVWLVGAAALITTATLASIPMSETFQLPFSESRDAPVPAMATSSAPGTQSLRETPDVDGVWREIAIRRGDTFTQLMQRTGLEIGDLITSLRNNPEARPLTRLRPGQRLRVRTGADGQIHEVSYELDASESLRLTRRADGYEVRREARQLETRVAHVTGTIHKTLFEDGQEAGMSDALILKLVEIFGWDIDFALDLRRGDRFSVIHEEKYWLGQKIADGTVLAAEFVNRGRTYRAFAHRDPAGFTRYYEPDGLNKRRDFLRTPIEFSRVSSGFSLNRFHPILKTWTAHKGVDYAAPAGTPVRATATGRVLALGAEGGYGKRIVLKHGGAYSTLYAHLSRYQSNLRVGSYVEQGQVIGYVGSTGLSTGPHLHYEFQVDGQHRNPLTMKFPGTASIGADFREAFLADTRMLSARLDLIGQPAVALNDR